MRHAGLDGSGLTLMNAGNFDHRAEMSRSGRFFVNNFSTVSSVPEAALYDGTGAEKSTWINYELKV